MRKHMLLTVVAAFGLVSVMVLVPVRQAPARGNKSKHFVPPTYSGSRADDKLDSGLGR
jgi:hypothetical protein